MLLVPDQWLFGVPWAALFDGTAAFGERYALTLLPSLALLGLHLPSSPAGPASTGALLLGYAGNPPLPQVAQELAQVQASLPHARLINPASKTDLADLSHQSLLHIAAHGRLETTNPLLSHIELADGNLLLAELFQLDLHGVELVTLSACESGLAPQQGGLPLALAGTLLIAGAQRTLSSLWPVEDAATTHLMTHFYQRLSQGESHPRALQQAQAHLRNQGYRHPFYWAPSNYLAACSRLPSKNIRRPT